MDILAAIGLAILQGVTELFPISSLGHAVIVPAVLNMNIDLRSPEFLPFLVVMHFGTAVALLVYFWRDWLAIALGIFGRGPKAPDAWRALADACFRAGLSAEADAAYQRATLVAVHGGISHRIDVAAFVAAGFALAGLLATRVVPAGPPHPQAPEPQHLFRHQAGGIP